MRGQMGSSFAVLDAPPHRLVPQSASAALSAPPHQGCQHPQGGQGGQGGQEAQPFREALVEPSPHLFEGRQGRQPFHATVDGTLALSTQIFPKTSPRSPPLVSTTRIMPHIPVSQPPHPACGFRAPQAAHAADRMAVTRCEPDISTSGIPTPTSSSVALATPDPAPSPPHPRHVASTDSPSPHPLMELDHCPDTRSLLDSPP
jgi:hypothetical protein